MRFPWLQVDADFIAAHAGDLGAYLGISRREAIGLAVDLWTWALARAPDDAPPDGVVTGAGAVPDRLLSSSVGWAGPIETFINALLSCGLAVRVDGGYRLTGFKRYKATWEKNRRRTRGKPEGSRREAGAVPDRKTQTQTQTQKKEEDPPNPPGGEGDVKNHSSQAAPQPSPGGDWTIPDAVDAVHRKVKEGKPYGWDARRDDAAAGRLMSLCAQEGIPAARVPEEIARRFGRALVRSLPDWHFEPGPGKAATLARLANPECWKRNSEPPMRTVSARGELTGVTQVRHEAVEPWLAVVAGAADSTPESEVCAKCGAGASASFGAQLLCYPHIAEAQQITEEQGLWGGPHPDWPRLNAFIAKWAGEPEEARHVG